MRLILQVKLISKQRHVHVGSEIPGRPCEEGNVMGQDLPCPSNKNKPVSVKKNKASWHWSWKETFPVDSLKEKAM